MRMEFAKLNGLGNDFIIADDMPRDIELTEAEVQHLCDRHFGIGADGVILVRPADDGRALAYMHYINSDGTLAQMCGNGVRCFAKYLVDRGFANVSEGTLIASTMAGERTISFTVDADGKLEAATVDMGAPILEPAQVPVACEANAATPDGIPFVREAKLSSPWGDFAFTCVSMGNPHAICFIDAWDELPDALFRDPAHKSLDGLLLDGIGAAFESHPAFPEKTNVEFAEITPDGIAMRVYERGCGETLACGTGACATFVAACLTHRAQERGTVHLLGGDLHIEWDGTSSVFMTGPAEESFTGTIEV